MKTCSKCNQEKPLTEYYTQKSNKDGLYTYCKQCAYTNSRKWFNKNREENLQYHKNYRLHNKESVDAKIDAWKKENVEKVREYKAKWKKNNPEAVLTHKAHRRATMLNATYGNEELNDLVFKEAFTLAKLRKEATGVDHHVDHIVPLRGDSVCGFHAWNNIRVVPANENIAKGNKLIEDLL